MTIALWSFILIDIVIIFCLFNMLTLLFTTWLMGAMIAVLATYKMRMHGMDRFYAIMFSWAWLYWSLLLVYGKILEELTGEA